MALIDKVKDALGSKEPEKVTVRLEDAEEFLRERKASEIQEAEEKAEELTGETQGLVDRLEEGLEELKGYEDKKGIQAVEDVAENFYRSRKKIVKEFEASPDIEEHFDRLDDMLEKFNDVSMKEGAVMNRVHQSSGNLSERIESVMEHRDEIKQFIGDEYRPVKQLEEVREAVDEVRGLEERKESLEDDLQNLKARDFEEDIAEKEEELESLEQRPEWSRKLEIESSIDELEEEKSELEAKHSRNASVLERGLKKLIYSTRNQGLDFRGDIQVLEAIRDEDFERVESPAGDLEKAVEALDEEDILGDRQLSKFSEAVEAFKEFRDERQRIQEIGSQIKDLREELEDLDIIEERDEMERRIKALQKKRKDRQREQGSLREEIEKVEQDLEASTANLESYLNDVLEAEVNLERRE